MISRAESKLRKDKIIALREHGITYRSIGNQFNLSTQRVQQIISDSYLAPKTKKKTKAQAKKDAAHQRREDKKATKLAEKQAKLKAEQEKIELWEREYNEKWQPFFAETNIKAMDLLTYDLLSVRSYNVLQDAAFKYNFTAKDVFNNPMETLLTIRNCGTKSVNEITQLLGNFQSELKAE
ncbi:MAG TPA: DNA-directed RNA polymerase subunit alpha C-terminal domain-containing protein [Pyrinomonadaceae bacterium]|nr:DNA-directed RNA polymerase subunit alpha C-terminal domain-containing protein [Pyrinomonadaceae bacterium]